MHNLEPFISRCPQRHQLHHSSLQSNNLTKKHTTNRPHRLLDHHPSLSNHKKWHSPPTNPHILLRHLSTWHHLSRASRNRHHNHTILLWQQSSEDEDKAADLSKPDGLSANLATTLIGARAPIFRTTPVTPGVPYGSN